MLSFSIDMDDHLRCAQCGTPLQLRSWWLVWLGSIGAQFPFLIWTLPLNGLSSVFGYVIVFALIFTILALALPFNPAKYPRRFILRENRKQDSQ